MHTARLHVTGASGSGTTTLGRALAQSLAVPHIDSDDLFWCPTNPPYLKARPVAERLRLLDDLLGERPGWVISGSFDTWAAHWADRLDMALWLDVPTAVRLERLTAREIRRYGPAAIARGGAQHAEHIAFLEWAAGYDTGSPDSRSRERHRAWLADLACPVLRLDGTLPTAHLVATVLATLTAASATGQAVPARA